MKRFTFIITLSLLFPLIGFSQSSQVYDDIYFKPSDAKIVQKQKANKEKPNYKNGAKEIIYVDRNANQPDQLANDSAKLIAQANDSTEAESGYYLNGFNGSESDLEYAKRIRLFHNPKYEVFIGDPNYNDIYFLNSSDWNVYIDGNYAYVTPTWTNSYWWDYNTSPYSSWGYGYGYYSPYSYGWYNYPWSYSNFYGYGGYYGGFYGGFGYGYPYGYGYGYYPYYDYGYGYGYPYYGYGYGYGYPYYGYGWSGKTGPTHSEGERREISNYNSAGNRLGGLNSTASTVIAGGSGSRTSQNPYTTISGTGSRVQSSSVSASSSRATRLAVGSNGRTYQTNGIGLVRSGGIRTSGYNASNQSPTRVTTTINTTPRTVSSSAAAPARNNGTSVTRSNTSSQMYSGNPRSSSSYSSSESRSSNYSSSTRSSSSYTPSYSNSSSSSSSSSSFSSGSRSSGSFSSGSSSSSSGGGGGSRSSGGGSSSGGRR